MSAAYLLLCHRPPHYWAALARACPETRFYLHYDAKSDIRDLDFLRPIGNIIPIGSRTAVNWGGYSMVAATLDLMRAALDDTRNSQFHLASGQCVLLQHPDTLGREFGRQPENTLLLDSRPTLRLRYRTRFDTPHADTAWQRCPFGKILTKCFQAADRLLPSAVPAYTGSQWFSARRGALSALLALAETGYAERFCRKLCPDEHFFQTIAAEHPEHFTLIPGHRRFIRFAPRANHPDLLGLDELRRAAAAGYWFARKVDGHTASAFLQETVP